MSILDHFRKDWTPHPEQRDLLLRFEEHFHDYEVIGLEGPTALGKSPTKMAIASWVRAQHMSVALTNPTKVLVNQDENNYDLPVLKSTWDYPCKIYKTVGRAKQRLTRRWRGHLRECAGCSAYEEARKVAKDGPLVLSNAYTYMAHRLYKNVLLMDEGHNTVKMLKDLHTKQWWKTDDLHWPHDMWDREQMTEWMSSLPESYILEHKLRPLMKELTTLAPRFSITRTAAPLRNKLTECIKMVPIDMRGEAPLLWPGSTVKKIVFLSATMSQKDLDTMGLGQRRCVIIPSKSPIPAAHRPIYPVCQTSMSFDSPTTKYDELAEYIKGKLDLHPDKGLVHLPYEVVSEMKKRLDHPRLMWHTKTDKSYKLKRFMRSQDKVLVCSGMTEGVDLVEDLGRWQIIGKVPWPSLGDPAVKAWSERDPDAYTWEALKEVIQACGRICRTPTDYGVTYIFDKSFLKLMEMAEEAGLIPEWWREALVYDGVRAHG
jgi:Rad3-related DNA helicase